MSGSGQDEDRFHSLPGSASQAGAPGGSRTPASGFNTPERGALHDLRERATFHPVSAIKSMITSFRNARLPSAASDSEPIDTDDLRNALSEAEREIELESLEATRARLMREIFATNSRRVTDSGSDTSDDDTPEAHINMMSAGGKRSSRSIGWSR